MFGNRKRPLRPVSRFTFLLLSLLVVGCADYRRENAALIAGQAGLHRVSFDTESFVLIGFLRDGGKTGETLITYIEGDGLAWVSRYTLSSDPTPHDPLGLRLAATDPAATVLYLGRPCQYVEADEARTCNAHYWSDRRFAPEVITATNQAIDAAKRRVGADRVVLIGYSGGGDVAALAAARRLDVAAWATVAAPIDQAAWIRLHAVSPLAGSLNPLDDAPRLAGLPQIHFVGARDDIVPPTIVRGFLDREGLKVQGHLVVVPDTDHHCCWVEHWPKLRPLIPLS